MRLLRFRVKNYRCVDDSGWIDVRDKTALVGRNESGKTNLLLALQSLNPPEGLSALNSVKDYPRDRNIKDFDDSTRMLETEWHLTDAEQSELTNIFPRAEDVSKVSVSRAYKAKRYVGFSGLPSLSVDRDLIDENVESLQRSISASTRALDESARGEVKQALSSLVGTANRHRDRPRSWASSMKETLGQFEDKLTQAELSPSDKGQEALRTLLEHAEDILRDSDAKQEALNWVGSQLPVFVYLDEYPRIEGHQDLTDYLERLKEGEQTEEDENFGKLMKVAGLDAGELNTLLEGEHEKRNQLVNRASAYVTQRIKELWRDRDLKIRFNVDREHFDTFVIDSQAVYDVEVNLNERSRGFRWFFSFYVTFAADTQGGPKEDAVLLLDEPGLHLHAVAQEDLLRHFDEDFENQIIYTTHSPFMIPTDDLPSVRTVTISQETGTKVTNDPTGDAKTLFPLQTALGYSITQSLFIGKQNLVVEGVTDYWYLSGVSSLFHDTSRTALRDEVVITPAGGAQKVSYMVALLASQDLQVAVLLDAEDEARRTAMQDLVKQKLIRDDYLTFVSEGFKSSRTEADVEDLLDDDVFDGLVREAYEDELEGRTLTTNDQIPRLVNRYKEAFEDIGLEFHKTRPAKLFLTKLSEDPDTVLTSASADRFENLFGAVNERFEMRERRDHGPFE